MHKTQLRTHLTTSAVFKIIKKNAYRFMRYHNDMKRKSLQSFILSLPFEYESTARLWDTRTTQMHSC